MALTKEQVRKRMECKTADELLALAKSWGVEMTREQAEDYVANMKTVELTEEELKQVAGGDEIEAPWCDYICRELFCPDVNPTMCKRFCGRCWAYERATGRCVRLY